ncbi:MAG: hypothetical protein DRQ04_04920 [Candidatus Hydrothermota bacterium]|nr:MAG: hypothetical protein DRQ04_04920 [Candidatus Hydrothermae bacterium]
MIGIVLNPVAGGGKALKKLPEIKNFFRSLKVPFELRISKMKGECLAIARYFAEKGYSAVVAAGGDGTVNEVGQPLVGTKTAISVIPLGTGNDYFKALFCKLNWKDIICQGLIQRVVARVDVGFLKCRGLERHFFNGMGIGIDSQVLYNLEKMSFLRFFGEDVIYLASIIKSFLRYRPPEFVVTAKDFYRKGRFFFFNIGCGQFLAGGLKLFPRANFRDGLLDLSLIERVSFLKLLFKIPKVFHGRHLGEKEVFYRQISEAKVHVDGPFALQMDGELVEGCGGWLHIVSVPQSLNVLGYSGAKDPAC